MRSPISAEVRQKLCEIVARYGAAVGEDPRLLEGLLKDLCGEHRREISVLVAAVRERVPTELSASSDSVPMEALVARLTTRLQDNQGIGDELAVWAVRAWAAALGRLAPMPASSAGYPASPPSLYDSVVSAVGARPALGGQVSGGAPATATPVAPVDMPPPQTLTSSTLAAAPGRTFRLTRWILTFTAVAVILVVVAGFFALRSAGTAGPQPDVTQKPLQSPVSTGANTSYATFVGARFEVIKNGDGGRRYLLIHGNEYTARKALRDYLQSHQGTGYLVVGTDRFIEYDGAKLDPNRLFSREGAEKNLRRLNVASISPKLPSLLEKLDPDRGKFVSVLTPPLGGLLVAPHNTSQHSIQDEIPLSDSVSMKDARDPFSFMLCTSESDYAILARSPYNVVLQLRVPKDDDGSLSRLAARDGIRYVNIETPLGQTQKQLRMIAWVDENLP